MSLYQKIVAFVGLVFVLVFFYALLFYLFSFNGSSSSSGRVVYKKGKCSLSPYSPGDGMENLLSKLKDFVSCADPTVEIVPFLENIRHMHTSVMKSYHRNERLLSQFQVDYKKCVTSHSPVISNDYEQDVDYVARQKRKRDVVPVLTNDMVPPPADAIDIVYLWVNGTDPSWKFSRNAFGASDIHSSREDNGSLKYSIRSLLKYSGDLHIGTIYIVTSLGQVPQWLEVKLKDEYPNLRIVKDSSLFSPKMLPTFNPQAILTRIYAIPGLREYFVLWQDDMFLGKRAHRADFWRSSGGGWGPRIFFEKKEMKPQKFAETDALLDNLLGVKPSKRSRRNPVAHAPIPLCKTVLRYLVSSNPHHFRSTFEGKFEKHSDIFLVHFYAHWMLEHNLLGESGSSKDIYSFHVVSENQLKFQDVIKATHDHTFVSIRDGGKKVNLTEFFETRWPFPSKFEKKNKPEMKNDR